MGMTNQKIRAFGVTRFLIVNFNTEVEMINGIRENPKMKKKVAQTRSTNFTYVMLIRHVHEPCLTVSLCYG